MLTYLETHHDLSPASPQVITGSFVIECTDITARYKINPDIPHAFLVRTAADITVKDASGNTLTKDSDFYLRQTQRDAYYSKEYSLSSIFSEIQFAAVGSYTVTRHLCVGTYVTASWLNAVKLAIKDILASIQGILTTLSSHTTTLDNHATTLSDHNTSLSDHASRITVLESNPTIIVVADHATMEALTGLKTGTTVYVVADTDGKRAEYLYDGTTFQKTSDPDWENINLDWSALLNIPTGVAALIAGTLASTALADMPTPADTDDTKVLSWDKTTGKYKLLTVSAAAGVGDVSSNSTSSTAGHFAVMADGSGKVIEDSGIAPSDLYASACATQEVTTADVTITDAKKGTLILTGALTGDRIVYLPASVWRKTIICDCTGSYYIRVLAVGQTAGGVYLAPGDAADVYCDGAVLVKMPVNANSLGGFAAGLYPHSVRDLDGAAQPTSNTIYRVINSPTGMLYPAPFGIGRSFSSSSGGRYVEHHYQVGKAIWTQFTTDGNLITLAGWAQLTDANGNAVFPVVATTASAANAYIAGNGNTILRSTSSARYKTDIRDLDDTSSLDALRPVLYKSNPETVPGDDPTLDHYGFIAEEVDKIDAKLVEYKEDETGKKIPDGVQYDRVTVLLVKRIHELEARLKKAGL